MEFQYFIFHEKLQPWIYPRKKGVPKLFSRISGLWNGYLSYTLWEISSNHGSCRENQFLAALVKFSLVKLRSFTKNRLIHTTPGRELPPRAHIPLFQPEAIRNVCSKARNSITIDEGTKFSLSVDTLLPRISATTDNHVRDPPVTWRQWAGPPGNVANPPKSASFPLCEERGTRCELVLLFIEPGITT